MRRLKLTALFGSVALIVGVIALVALPAQAGGVSCLGSPATKTGTSGNDTITGTGGAEMIASGATTPSSASGATTSCAAEPGTTSSGRARATTS